MMRRGHPDARPARDGQPWFHWLDVFKAWRMRREWPTVDDINKAREQVVGRGLTLTFKGPDEPYDVVSVAYRNDYGTQSATILFADSIAVICEHGGRFRALNFNDAFRAQRRPQFCDKCLRFAVGMGGLPSP